MSLMRVLVIAALGMTTTTSYAVPVAFTLHGEPFTEWEFAQRDSAEMITSIDVADVDGDGIVSFVAEVVPRESAAVLHVKSGPAQCMYIILEFSSGDRPLIEGTLPFVQDIDRDSLIVEWLGFASGGFSIGQPLTVSNGTIAGLDGLVRENSGIATAADLLAIDVRSLPTFTGAAEVVGLVSVRVIPEPSTGALILFGVSGLISFGRLRCRTCRN
jgi:hypothetical protein